MNLVDILPEEIWANEIMKNLSLRDILNLEQTNKCFQRLSKSEKGELLWKQKLQNKFPGAYEVKTSGMPSREMYIRIAQAFGLLNVDFTNKLDPNIDLKSLPYALFGNKPSGIDIPLINNDNDPGIAKYFIQWAMQLSTDPAFLQNKRKSPVNSDLIVFQSLYVSNYKEIIDWFLLTYNYSIESFIKFMITLDISKIPVERLKYVLSQAPDKSKLKEILRSLIKRGWNYWSDEHRELIGKYYDSLLISL